ncbi:MAG: MSHA biogenesis protein MshN [Alteromonadaceae bacterium]|nr:MSHA biogenesis protein MshN [Alteromonadaceae bacterium]
MSLLNDALKAAEQRQNRPQISGAYTGQALAEPARRGWLPWLLVFLLLALIGAGAAWWWLQGNTEQSPQTGFAANPAEPTAPEATVAEGTGQEPGPEPIPEPSPQSQPEPEPVPEPVQPIQKIVEPTPRPEPEPEPASSAEPQSEQGTEQGMEPAQEPMQKPEPSPEPVSEPSQEPEGNADNNAESDASPAPVKQARQTPEAIDRQTARELESLLASGRTTEAEQRLTELTQSQPAPRSREAFAREMLIQQMPERALGWLPEPLAADHANLRLLRARAQLEQGNLQTAIATLESRVPAVDASPEYRITLATLLQQAGEAEESAGHWSELIAHDNNQPTWWLGLAMALEEGGRADSAARAYGQAATMAGLPDNLADFARQRLQALQAGQ